MVRIFTLFHRVDGFNESDDQSVPPDFLDQHYADRFLHNLLEPLVYDPGETLVQAILQKG